MCIAAVSRISDEISAHYILRYIFGVKLSVFLMRVFFCDDFEVLLNLNANDARNGMGFTYSSMIFKELHNY